MKFTAIVFVVGALWAASAAQAQIVGDDISANVQASWNTASAGTMALRSPGNMVTRGRVAYREVHAQSILRSRRGPVIDEAAPEGPTLDQQVRIEVIEAVFDNVNAALLVLLNTIRASGGLPPTGSTDLTDLLGRITQTP